MIETAPEKLKFLQKTLPSFCLLAIAAGIYGFVYEFIFYYINGDMNDLYWRGSHFLPWITIYAVGGLIIYALTYKLAKRPVLVCIAGGLGCGALELISGLALYYISGTRAWDYNTEKWNFGNIGGFICLRSVVVFALSSLLLVYVIVPFIRKLRDRLSPKAFHIICYTVTGVFLADFIYNAVLVRLLGFLVSANGFYSSLGMQILNY